MKLLAVILPLLCLFGDPARSESSPLGLRVMVQPWEPQTDDETVFYLLDQPTAISDFIDDAWREVLPNLQDRLVSLIAQADLVAPGVTFYDIDLRLPRPSFDLVYLAGGGNDPLLVRLDATVRGAYLEMTSTTPTDLGDWGDPRCEARADVVFSLFLTIGPDPSRPIELLTSQQARESALRISNFAFDSQNLPCDAVVAVADLVGAAQTIITLVENPSNTRPLVDAFLQMFGPTVEQWNRQVAAVVPPGLGVMKAFLTPRPEGGRVLAIFFGQPSYAPDPGPPATISGTLTVIGEASFDCSNLPVSVERKTGPAPILNGFGTRGAPQTELLVTTVTCGAANADGSVPFQIAGLSSVFPNLFTFTGLAAPCRAGEIEKEGWLLTAERWPDQAGLTRTLDAPYDLTASKIEVPCPPEFETARSIGFREDLVVNPVDIIDPSGDFAVTDPLTALNPQPLPPDPDALTRNLRQQIELQKQIIQLQSEQLRLQGFGP